MVGTPKGKSLRRIIPPKEAASFQPSAKSDALVGWMIQMDDSTDGFEN
jgi:hypothetical protein